MKLLLLATFVGIFFLEAGCAPQAGNSGAVAGGGQRNGKAEARKDMAAGHLYLKAYGIPQPATEQYAALLQEDMHVTYQQVGGCMVDKAFAKYVADYNKVVLDYLAEKYGPNAVMNIWNRANDAYQAKVKAVGG